MSESFNRLVYGYPPGHIFDTACRGSIWLVYSFRLRMPMHAAFCCVSYEYPEYHPRDRICNFKHKLYKCHIVAKYGIVTSPEKKYKYVLIYTRDVVKSFPIHRVRIYTCTR